MLPVVYYSVRQANTAKRALPTGLEAAQQKYGGKYFKDPKKNRAMNEKITDFLRKFFEKKTGYPYLPRPTITPHPPQTPRRNLLTRKLQSESTQERVQLIQSSALGGIYLHHHHHDISFDWIVRGRRRITGLKQWRAWCGWSGERMRRILQT